MVIKTRGIILKTMKYSETSVITDIYTEEKGLQTYIISGVRSKKAKVNASLLQIMSLVEMVAYYRENKSLNRTKEIKAALVYSSIPFDIRKSAVGLFIAEIAQKTIQEAEENKRLFQFLFDIFEHLDQCTDSVANLPIYFMVGFSSFLGFLPGGNYDRNTVFDLREGIFVPSSRDHLHCLPENLSGHLNEFLQSSLGEYHKINLTKTVRKDLLRELLKFYRFHIDSFPEINAHLILKEVLGS
ncbi:MAG: DNA repair protein RecO [Saprospiraceae bacterium]